MLKDTGYNQNLLQHRSCMRFYFFRIHPQGRAAVCGCLGAASAFDRPLKLNPEFLSSCNSLAHRGSFSCAAPGRRPQQARLHARPEAS